MDNNREKGSDDRKAVIELDNVKREFVVGDEVVHALRGVDLDVAYGELMMLVGPSGCGKTTLISVLAGILDRSGGQCEVLGQDLDALSASQRTRWRGEHIGFVFQSYNLIQGMTAVENVAMPLMFRRVSRKKREEAAREMLKQVGLGERMDHRPNEMSGGQQQRVGIARAFVTNPEVVFADEPTGNLDTKTTKEVMEMFLRFAREKGTTIILVTHDRSLAEYCDRIVTISDGRIISNEDHRHAKAIQDPPAAPAEELPETLHFTDNTLAAGQGGV
jgi:putative ABC transport system ATP-binding protein